MTTTTDPFQCGVCFKTYPVPSLALDCVERHERRAEVEQLIRDKPKRQAARRRGQEWR